MRVRRVEAIPLDARLKDPFKFGRMVRTRSSNVLVRLEADDGSVGWGEACPVPQLTGETSESIVALISERLTPQLQGQDPTQWRPLMDALGAQLHGCPATRAAVETALLDLVGKCRGVSIAELLGGRYRDIVEIHGSVGWEEDPLAMAETAIRQAERYRTLKLYVGRDDLGSDLDRLTACRRAVGEDHPFIVDVNGLWTLTQAVAAAPRLADLGVTILEQPLRPADRIGLADARRSIVEHYPIQIAADESILSPSDVIDVARDRTATIANVGITKLGGPVVAHAAATVAAAVHLGVLIGSVVELGIATAAGLQLAAAVPELAGPAYLGGPAKYVQQVTSPIEPAGRGRLVVPSGPGLGIEVDEAAVAAMDLRAHSRT